MKNIYYWIESLNTSFWERVQRTTIIDEKSVCVFRIIVSLFLLLFYFPSFSWITEDVHAIFRPKVLSLANFFPTFPNNNFFIVLDCTLLISLFCMLFGIKARAATLVYTIGSLIGLSFQYAFGKIDHTILLYAMLFCMSFSGWGTKLALLPDKKVSALSLSRSLGLLSIFICFGMFTAGFEKALSWIDFNNTESGFAAWFYGPYYNLERKELLAPVVFNIPFSYFDFFDYAAVAFELSPFFFLLHSRKAWLTWLLVACCFHLMNTLLLNIPFSFQWVVYAAFVDFSKLYNIIKKLSRSLFLIVTFSLFILSISIARIWQTFNFDLSSNILWPDYQLRSNLYFAVFIWVFSILLLSRSLIRYRA